MCINKFDAKPESSKQIVFDSGLITKILPKHSYVFYSFNPNLLKNGKKQLFKLNFPDKKLEMV